MGRPLLLYSVTLLLPVVFASEFTVVEAPEEAHGVRVAVVDAGAYRFLLAGSSIVGASFVDSVTEPAFALWAVVGAAVEGMRLGPGRLKATSVLQLGLGAGFVPSYLARTRRDVVVDVVEWLPPVTAAARKHFELPASVHVVHGDAADVVAHPEAWFPVQGGLRRRRYDVLLHDLFLDLENPSHALTVGVFGDAKTWLSPQGALVVSVVSTLPSEECDTDAGGAVACSPPPRNLAACVQATLESVFTHVQAYRDVPLDVVPDEAANLVFVASDGRVELGPDATAAARWASAPRLSGAWSAAHYQEWAVDLHGGAVLDDDTAAEGLQAGLSTELWNTVRGFLPSGAWALTVPPAKYE